MNHLSALQYGFGFVPAMLTLNRFALGCFFAISGYHKLFNKDRHATIVKTLADCGVPYLKFNQWFVPSVEFFGGLSLISGILAPFAAMGLIAVCLVASCTDGIKRIRSWAPIDKADVIDDVLYLPEVLYIIGLMIVLAYGPGPLTIPAAVGL